MSTFADFLWLVIVSFAFVAYLIVLFQIVTDLFRDRHQKGWHKALWIVGLIVFPLLTAVVYLIARGHKMGEQAAADAKAQDEAFRSYVRDAAGTTGGASTADELERLSKLHQQGILDDAEYAQAKA